MKWKEFFFWNNRNQNSPLWWINSLLQRGKRSPTNHLPPHHITESVVQDSYRGQECSAVCEGLSSVCLVSCITAAWKRRNLDSPFMGNICWSMEKARAGFPLYREYLLPQLQHGKREIWNPLLWGTFAGAWRRRELDSPFMGNICYHNYISQDLPIS